MSIDFTGTWKNQHNSTLELHLVGGIVSGRFESGVGDDAQTLWVEVSGRVLGDVIAFNAVYPKYQSVGAWVGQHTVESAVENIKTHWIHATNIPDDQEQEWMWLTNRIGSDVFTRG